MARPHDLPEVLEIERGCFDRTHVTLLSRICGFTEHLLVSDRGEVLEGYVLTGVVEPELGRVVSLGVRQCFRREGVASRLMREVLDRLVEKGVESVVLEVRRSNDPARSLYRGLGFESTGVKTGYYADGEDAVVMRREYK